MEVYTRGMFSKNTVSTVIAPSGSFGGSVTMNLNNPYLPSLLRQQFCAFDTDTDAATYTPRFTPAQCAAAATATGPTDPNYRTVTFNLSRRATEVGPRISDYTSTVFDIRAGLRGAITSGIDWDLSGSYGESEKIQTIKNYTLQSRWRQAALANGTLANPVCQDTSNNCVPVNMFGADGSITPAMAAFLTEDSTTTVRTSLAQVRGVVSGELGIASPAASTPIGFALGGEFRDYAAQQASDLLAKTPGELGGAGGAAPDINGGYNVWEGYAELIAPLVEDRPMFKSLTVEGGVRYSKYSVDGGGKNETWTYKAGASWEPVADVKFRGNYAHAVRAPNIGELFTPLTTGLTNLGVDPCAGTAPTTNANLRAVCLAQGAPVGTIGSITNPTAGQANITSGGNLTLAPEKADTFTAGVVVQPSMIPGLSLSIDYYNIKVKDVIGSPLPGDLVSACFGSISAASATNPDCTVIRRNPVTGGLDGDPATTPGLYSPLSNLGKLATDGVDLIANYNRDLGFGKLALSFVGNYTANSKYQATPGGLDRNCVGYYSVNCSFTGSIQPKYQFSQRTTLSVGKLDASLLWRWMDRVEFEPQQLADDLAAAASCRDPNGADPDGCMVEPDFRFIPSESYFDLTLRFNATDNFTFTATVQNLFNNQPKVVGNTIGSTSYNSGNVFPSTYDALGRRFAVAAKLRF